MLNSSSRCLRTAASSTPSGTRTAFSVHSRSPSRRQHRQAERRQRLEQRAMVALVPRPARLEPFLLDDRQRLVQRVDQRRRHRVVILAAQPVVLEQRADRSRSCGTSRAARARADRRRPAPDPTARPGTSACSCRRRRCPRRRRRAACPPSEVTASTIVSAPCSRAIAASSRTGFSTPVDVSAWTIATTSARRRLQRASRSASGSQARPHSTSSRVTVAP